jgi:DNA repair exonuclease SbcCD nuclease subunit
LADGNQERRGACLLAIGDVHLGTRPGSLPEDLGEWGVDPRELTPEAALEAAVDGAIELSVDAVLFAGDVVESTNARFEAIRPLERAVQRLSDAQIPVFGVAGNHDVEALPRLARMIDGFDLIGEAGRWESRVVEIGGRPVFELLGWSFPEPQVHTSPLATLLHDPLGAKHPGLPRLGVLHGDLDASGGPYAPFTRRELDAVGLDAWLLGHIHKPSLGSGPAGPGAIPRGYLGSLVGLDPTETGLRGPWLIHLGATGEIVPEQLQIARLRWELLEVAVEEEEDPEDLGDRLLDEAERLARRIRESGASPRVLGVRVRLTGPTCAYQAIRRKIEQGAWSGTPRQVGETVVFIGKVIDGLELALDLADLAKGNDPPALLARKLIALDGGGEDRRRLLDGAREELSAVATEPRWAPLAETRDAADPLSDEALAACLKQAGTVALHALLSQRAPAGADAGGDP